MRLWERPREEEVGQVYGGRLGRPLAIPQPRPGTHNVGPAQPSGSWQPPLHSGQPLELHSGSQGPKDGGEGLVRTMHPSPVVT